MEYIKKDFGSYKLHLIKTDKFKSITVRVSFHRVIKKDEITIRNILSDMFMQSSKKYSSKRELTIKAQDLYAAGLRTTNSRLGNYINTDLAIGWFESDSPLAKISIILSSVYSLLWIFIFDI